MKSVILFMLALVLSLPLSAQSTGKSSKSKSKANQQTEVKGDDDNAATDQNDDDGDGKDSKKKKSNSKDDKSKSSKTEKKETPKPAPRKAPAPHPHPAPSTHASPNSRKKAEDAPAPDPEVVQMYLDLPLEDLPQMQDYLTKAQAGNTNADLKDGADFRKGFIKNTDANRGYLQLQRLGETGYTRIQEFKTKDFKRIIAVESTNCLGTCTNNLKLYRKDGDSWSDVTSEYIAPLDTKSITRKLKDKYKEEYMDLDLYDSRGYDNEDNLKKAITYTISADENKIVVKEQYLPLSLYELTWNADKGKFETKKL